MRHPRSAALLFTLLLAPIAAAAEYDIPSPDHALVATLNADPAAHLSLSLKRGTQTLLLPSNLGIIIDGRDLGLNAACGKVDLSESLETYPTLGAHAIATNHFRGAAIPMKTGDIPWTLHLRVFNDAVAYRYEVPGAAPRKITGESSQWILPPDARAFYQPLNARKDYETLFVEAAAADLKIDTPIAAPAAFKLADNAGYLMITEANLINYSDMALQVPSANHFAAFFHNTPDGWSAQGDVVSPWRVAIAAPDLTTLVNTDVLHNLCPPAPTELANADWINPGRATWSWMVSRQPKLPMQHQWIDWTSSLGFEYYIIDDGWKLWKADGKDAWACMQEVVAYAKTKNVKIYAWVNCNEVTAPADRKAYFEKAAAAGIAGLKIDFMKPADPAWVQWYDDTLRDAAAAHLMIDFHGALKPSGRERTWPNELTREAIRGREGGKLPGLHDTALPFTRFVQGPADYTPTDFRPEIMKTSTWSRELAQAIVYTSPLLCLSGSPQDYLANPAIDIIKALPSTWDQTIVLEGSEIGQVAAFARRKGNDWFIAVVNGAAAHTLTLPLNFLPANTTFTSDQFTDAPDKSAAYTRSNPNLTAKDSIPLQLRPDGGFVARLTPQKP